MSILLILLYAGYIAYLYKESLVHRKNNAQEVQEAFDSVKDVKINYLKILISLILIYVGVEASIMAATFI
jgi:Ca2+/Na+ antiporter